MSTLLLRLAAPLQSWGIDSKFDIRRTGREPSKSGVIGLICAALGIKRDDDDMVSQLATLRFGVRVDKEGHFVRDFHMVRPKKGEPYVTNRYYLADAEFLVGFESVDEELLKKIEYALLNPVFPLYLGRRSCPPTGRLCLGIRKLELEEALLEEAFRNESTETVRRGPRHCADRRPAHLCGGGRGGYLGPSGAVSAGRAGLSHPARRVPAGLFRAGGAGLGQPAL